MLAVALSIFGCQPQDTSFRKKTDDTTAGQGTGVAEIIPDAITWVDLQSAVAYSEPFKITNVGKNVLQVYQIDVVDSGGGTFYAEDIDAFSLDPGAEREFLVVATLDTKTKATGDLRIKTSDAKALDHRIPLSAALGTKTGTPVDTADTGVK